MTWIISGGLGVAFSNAFGIEPSLLISSLCGAFLSPLLAERDVWWRAVLIFIGSVFVAALFGGAIGKLANLKESIYLNALVALVSLISRPFIMRLQARAPGLADGLVDVGLSRLGAKGKEPPLP